MNAMNTIVNERNSMMPDESMRSNRTINVMN